MEKYVPPPLQAGVDTLTGQFDFINRSLDDLFVSIDTLAQKLQPIMAGNFDKTQQSTEKHLSYPPIPPMVEMAETMNERILLAYFRLIDISDQVKI